METNNTQGVAGAADAKKGKPVVLSGGVIAYVRPPKGRDLEKGASAATNATNPMSLMMAVAAQVTTVGDKGVTYEELLEWPMADIMALLGELGGNVPGAVSRLSAISS